MEDIEKWKGRIGGDREVERKDGRIYRSGKVEWEDIKKWKGRMGEY